MADKDYDAQAISLVKEHWQGASPEKYEIVNRFPEFANGYLYVISVYVRVFHPDKTSSLEEHGQYVYRTGEQLKLCRNVNELALGVGKNESPRNLILDILSFAGISGAVALLITITLCYAAIYGSNNQNPDVMKGLLLALTAIIGYYFGVTTRQGISAE